MNKMLKIGAVSVALMLLSGCSMGEDAMTEKLTNTPQPTIGMGEQADPLVDENETDIIPTGMPQGDTTEEVILVIDPGHGGFSSGASYSGITEKDLTLQLAGYLKEYLDDNYLGITTILTRDRDKALADTSKIDLEERAIIAKKAGADALVSIHFNASDDHSQSGSLVLISHRENVTEACKNLGESILTQLSNLGLKNRGTVTRNSNDMFDESGNPLDYYAINRHCANRDIPGIIVEHCFMDNVSDQSFIDSEENLKMLAKADAVGIADYFGLAPKD